MFVLIRTKWVEVIAVLKEEMGEKGMEWTKRQNSKIGGSGGPIEI